MAGILITLALSMGMMTAIWLLLAPRRPRLPHARTPTRPMGELSADERHRLYQRLGLDPERMSRGQYSNVIWLDSRREPRRRSTKA